jgi:hypothetical protein
LEAAGLGPLVSQAAEISPRATRAVRERLDALPERLQFTWPFRHDLSYFVVLFLAQAGVATVLTLKVLPSLTRIRAAASFEIVDFAATVATALAFVGVLLATPLGNLVVRRALKDLRAAAVHAAAAGLAAAGVAGDAQRLLALHPEIGPSSANALTAISLDEISRQLVYRAQRSAARALLYTKLVGTALALGIALAIIGPVYAAIPALAKGISLP